MSNAENNIEIEVRGPLDKKKFDELTEMLGSSGKFITYKDRLLIDYTTPADGGIQGRKKDIRLRVTNGIPEVIVKIGNCGGSDKRKELSVKAGPGEFDTLVEIFGVLGMTKGVLCVRKIWVYEYKGIEFALVQVPGHSYYYEAEKMANGESDHARIIEEITNVCGELGLDVFTSGQFFSYIERLNREANEVFEYKIDNGQYFKTRFGI